jgi:aconitate hydratase A / 2-methylisocitrate dehydratase
MDSFGAAAELRVRDRRYAMYCLAALERHGFEISRLPYSLRILLENLLRNENGSSVTRDDIEALAIGITWPHRTSSNRACRQRGKSSAPQL